jgi:hypothetical protein
MIVKSLSTTRSLLFLFGLVLLLLSTAANAAITSAASGNGLLEQLGWVEAPTTADNVIISTGHIVTITASTSITDLNLSATNGKISHK